ncbi:AAA family ATPase [Deinococcus lacus]|uniref:AAA family ATPase n=1 Tax=Deinococcus lacus TaxID=392561 RepID=A0ABW1YJ82_9DEIO
MLKIIGVISFKDGVSKTTTALHVAAHLSERGKAVAVNGDDRNRSLTNWASSEARSFEVMSMMEAF